MSSSDVPASASACLDDAADVADVLARRQLRDDAAPLAMDRGLRRDDVRRDRPRTRGIAGLGDHRGRGLVAGRFDARAGARADQPACAARSANAFCSDSLYGAVKMPRSVMMPAM